MRMHLLKLVLKVNYLSMFGKRGYFDSVIKQYPCDDMKRVHLLVTVPEKHMESVKTYATSVIWVTENVTELVELIRELTGRIDVLEDTVITLRSQIDG